MHRRLPLVLGFLVLVAQPLQWYVIGHYGEPYPSLIFPVFPGPGDARNAPHFAWEPTFTAQWESGQTTDIPRADLFADVPLPARWQVILLNFGPDRLAETAPAARVSGWLPGRQQLWRVATNPARAREAAPWLKARVEKLYAGQRAVGMTILWQRGTERKSTFIEFGR
jgi:hypothetical protein